jgi:hypothetical protein
VGFRLAHGGGSANDNNNNGAVAVRHVWRVPFTHEEELAGGAARVTLLGPAPAPADECKAHGQLVHGTLTVLVGTSEQRSPRHRPRCKSRRLFSELNKIA